MISRIKSLVADRSRAWRSELFRDNFGEASDLRVLDLGGGRGRHIATYYPHLKNVCIADFNPAALAYARDNFGYDTRIVDGSERLPFADKEFDVVFCSSVIEHVTGPKAEAVARFKADGAAFRREAALAQHVFAEEIRRIARRYFVQTPNRYFPVEVHSWIPGIGPLPTHLQWQVIRRFNRFWPRKDDQPDWNLLSKKELTALFPEASIHEERLLGLAKSFIAIG